MVFYFKSTNKDILMAEEAETLFRNIIYCQFCEKKIVVDKVRDPCHLTGIYRGPARQKFYINHTRELSTFNQFIFQNSSSYQNHLFFKKLVDKKNVKVRYDTILRQMNTIFQ